MSLPFLVVEDKMRKYNNKSLQPLFTSQDLQVVETEEVSIEKPDVKKFIQDGFLRLSV